MGKSLKRKLSRSYKNRRRGQRRKILVRVTEILLNSKPDFVKDKIKSGPWRYPPFWTTSGYRDIMREIAEITTIKGV